ncbi:hypothetical protein DRQ53_00910 [bacterium]|nr:MAG: hypothetical protein DRQ32_11965 [bacterium]RKZ18329.1 MAG: hypothetical protein DRQ53_00910 [bacterium]
MPVLVCLFCLAAYFIGYRLWGRWLACSVFRLDASRVTPAQEKEDGVDYVPTRSLRTEGHS